MYVLASAVWHCVYPSHVHACRRWVDYEDKELDQQAVKLAEMVIKVGQARAVTRFDQC